jgi:hypothetical protein
MPRIHGGHLIFRNADDLAAQILRCANPAVGADVDVAVTEYPRHESRDAQVARIAAQARQDVRTGGQLGHVEILRVIDAREKLFRPQWEEVDVTSLHRHTTAHDRVEPIVRATGEADLKLGHLGKPPASVLHRGLARISSHVSFRPSAFMQLACKVASLAQRLSFH